MQRPIISLTADLVGFTYFDEAVVVGEVMSQGVLPSRAVRTVERKVVDDEIVDLTQCHHLRR